MRMRAQLAFRSEFKRFQQLSARSSPRFCLAWSERQLFLDDRTTGTPFDRHYIYHPAWAARVLARTRPALHVDIASTLHFCAIVSAFVPVTFYDYRPADLRLSDLSSEFADLLALPFPSGSVESLSCMHTVEHVGLGRYGDPIDPNGDLKAIAELKRVLAPGGSLLFVIPVGRPRILFNAHRIYAYDQIMSYFADLELREFALVPDHGGLVENATEALANAQTYGCGCFWFKKRR
jgi:SAM-dependent methyltransferase